MWASSVLGTTCLKTAKATESAFMRTVSFIINMSLEILTSNISVLLLKCLLCLFNMTSEIYPSVCVKVNGALYSGATKSFAECNVLLTVSFPSYDALYRHGTNLAV